MENTEMNEIERPEACKREVSIIFFVYMLFGNSLSCAYIMHVCMIFLMTD